MLLFVTLNLFNEKVKLRNEKVNLHDATLNLPVKKVKLLNEKVNLHDATLNLFVKKVKLFNEKVNLLQKTLLPPHFPFSLLHNTIKELVQKQIQLSDATIRYAAYINYIVVFRID